MNICLMAIGAGAAINALKWPLRSALFPIVMGIPVFLLALADLLLSFFEKEETDKRSAMDFKLSEDADQARATRRTLFAFAWIMGFFCLIIFLGFSIAIPIFVLLYLRLQGREKWGISLIMSALTFVFFWGLFVWLLHTVLPEGLVFRGLRAINN